MPIAVAVAALWMMIVSHVKAIRRIQQKKKQYKTCVFHAKCKMSIACRLSIIQKKKTSQAVAAAREITERYALLVLI